MHRIAVTMGDPAGIGGELVLRAFERPPSRTVPVIVGDLSVLEQVAGLLFEGRLIPIKPFGQGAAGDVEILDVGAIESVRFGLSDGRCGGASYRYIMEGLRLVLSGDVSAIVTCPINKKSVQASGMPFIGHTELLAHYGGVSDYVMMMAARSFRVCLVTIHVPLKDVPSLIDQERVFRSIALTARSLKVDFGIGAPRLKVCGLHPHAGEQGAIGTEDEAIRDAVMRAQEAGINVEGPFSADSLFHRPDCDAYVAMYHDQGLLPVKTIAFARCVNITLGLPFVRTSVGHGTGLDIAGTGVADPTSLIEAYRVAEGMIKSRSRI